jgi:hypothetical protein
MWRNYFCQLLNVHGVDVRQTQIRSAEPLVPESSSSEVEIAIEKLKRYKSPGIDQIPAELIQPGKIHYVMRSTSLLIVFGIRKNFQFSGRNLLLYLLIRRVIKRTVVIIEEYHLPTSYKIVSNIFLSRLTPYVDEIIEDHQCGFRRNRSTTDQIFCIRQILDKKWEYNGTVHQLYTDFSKAYGSVRREVLYKILLEFGIPRKLVRLIKTCLNETYSKIRIGKHLSGAFPVKNGLKQGDALSPVLFNFALEYDIRNI